MAKVAATSRSKMQSFLKKALKMGVEVQQSLAFRCLVDLFWQLVGPNRLSLKGALQHLFVTCSVLSPEHEKQALEGDILVEGGLVCQFPWAREESIKRWPWLQKNPDIEQKPVRLVHRDGFGIHAVAVGKAKKGDLVGIYPGIKQV